MEVDSQNNDKETRLRDVFKVYIISLIIFAVTCVIGVYTIILIPMIAYLGIGIFITKVYLPQLISFHPIYATIDNLVGIKIRSIILWPFFYFFLLMKLGFLHAMK